MSRPYLVNLLGLAELATNPAHGYPNPGHRQDSQEKMSSPKSIKWWQVLCFMVLMKWGTRKGGLQICSRRNPTRAYIVHLLITIVCQALRQALYRVLSRTFSTTTFYSISSTWAGQPFQSGTIFRNLGKILLLLHA